MMHTRATVQRPPHPYGPPCDNSNHAHTAPRVTTTTPLLSAQPPRDGYQGPKPLRDDNDAGTQSMSSSSHKGSTEPPCGNNVDTEHLHNGEKVVAVPRAATVHPQNLTGSPHHLQVALAISRR